MICLTKCPSRRDPLTSPPGGCLPGRGSVGLRSSRPSRSRRPRVRSSQDQNSKAGTPRKWTDERTFKTRGGEAVKVGSDRFRELTREGHYAHQVGLEMLGALAFSKTSSGAGVLPGGDQLLPRLWRPLLSDRYFVAVEKDSGLLSAPGKVVTDCLVTRVAEVDEFSSARIVHRLDRDTSGVLVLALNSKSLSALSIQFQDRKASKVYQALVHDWIEEEEGVIDLPIGKDPDPEAFPRMRIDLENGRPSQTAWRVLERLSEPVRRTRVELTPVTGRSHQLRLHMKAIGHPILGDTFHAPPDVSGLCFRLCLHAVQLQVNHPRYGNSLTFEAPCPF